MVVYNLPNWILEQVIEVTYNAVTKNLYIIEKITWLHNDNNYIMMRFINIGPKVLVLYYFFGWDEPFIAVSDIALWR